MCTCSHGSLVHVRLHEAWRIKDPVSTGRDRHAVLIEIPSSANYRENGTHSYIIIMLYSLAMNLEGGRITVWLEEGP